MFKNVLKKQNLIITVLALALIFCFSFGVSAAPLYADNDIEYLVGDSADYETSDSVTVTLNVLSKKVGTSYLDESATVTLPAVPGGKAYTVRDVLEAWATQNSVTLTTTTYNAELKYSEETPYVYGSSAYIFAMIKGEDRYSPADPAFYYDGWKFRVNTQLPLLAANWGATMADTYVNDGDVVTFYYDNPVSDADAARFTRIYEVANDTDSIQVTVQQSYDWFMTVSPWTATKANFAAAGNIPVVVKKANVEVGSGTTGSDGIADITIKDGVTAGNYTIEVDPAWKASGLLDRTGDSVVFEVQ